MPMMNLFEPLFLLLVLTAFVTLVTAAVFAIGGRFKRAGRILLRLVIGIVVYMAVVITVTVFNPRHVYQIGEEHCREDWCITVTGWRRASAGSGGESEAAIRLHSRARRVPMGERGTVIYVVDGAGRRFDPTPNAAELPFTTILQPGESVDTTRHFHIPDDARDLGVVYKAEGGFPIGWFIITEGGWFQPPDIVRLP